MTKKLYLPLLVALVAVLTSCSSKMGELSSDYFYSDSASIGSRRR